MMTARRASQIFKDETIDYIGLGPGRGRQSVASRVDIAAILIGLLDLAAARIAFMAAPNPLWTLLASLRAFALYDAAAATSAPEIAYFGGPQSDCPFSGPEDRPL